MQDAGYAGGSGKTEYRPHENGLRPCRITDFSTSPAVAPRAIELPISFKRWLTSTSASELAILRVTVRYREAGAGKDPRRNRSV
jgi:hypothetical protein